MFWYQLTNNLVFKSLLNEQNIFICDLFDAQFSRNVNMFQAIKLFQIEKIYIFCFITNDTQVKVV